MLMAKNSHSVIKVARYVHTNKRGIALGTQKCTAFQCKRLRSVHLRPAGGWLWFHQACLHLGSPGGQMAQCRRVYNLAFVRIYRCAT